jgi:site-specific recombinase XerD
MVAIMAVERWSPTKTEAYESFMLDAKARRCTPATLEHYKHRLKPFLSFLDDQQINNLSEITPTHIRSHLIALHERGLTSHSQHAAARAIRAWLNFCVTEELLSESPMKRVRMPRLAKVQKPNLSVDDVTKLLHYADDREAAMLLFLIDTGLRASEFCSLNGADIDIANGTVRIKSGKGSKDRTAFLGGKSRRQLMKFWRKNGRPEAKKPVWTSEKTGERLTRSGLRQILVKLGRRAGIANTNPHTLRRTFATWAWQGGMDLKSLQHLMGHSDLSVIKAYLGINDEDLRNAHEKHGPVDSNL